MAHETIHLGIYVIFGIILLPVYGMIAGWILGRPREYRSVLLAFGYIISFTVLILVGLAAMGVVISLITGA